MKQQCFSF